MGHLDRRIDQSGNPTSNSKAGVKDGPAGMKGGKAPHKDESSSRTPQKASDVVHHGGEHAKSPSKSSV
jgi:hypothetical protein